MGLLWLLCLILLTTVKATTQPDDIKIMCKLAKSIKGVNRLGWACKDNNEDVCAKKGDSWKGVQCVLNNNNKLYRVSGINLGANQLRGGSDDLVDMAKLPFLTVLVLQNNSFTGSIPNNIGSLAKLTRLELGTNGFTGTIPAKLWAITGLVELSLGNNRLNGTIAPAIGNLVNLTRAYFEFNFLSGSIPTAIGLLTKLEDWWSQNNALEGTIPKEFNKLNKLTRLLMYNNKLSGTIPNLENLIRLTYFHLSVNRLSGTIPSELQACPLVIFYAQRNQFIGTLPTFLSTTLEYWDLAFNKISGTLPTEIGKHLSLQGLWLDQNLLTGSIPTELGLLKFLSYFSLPRNNLKATIPTHLGLLTRLVHLNLRATSIHGSIPSHLGRLTQLTNLIMDTNDLTGTLPPHIGNCTRIVLMHLFSNRISGFFPDTIGRKLRSMQQLFIHSNEFWGQLALPNVTGLTQLLALNNYFQGSTLGSTPDLDLRVYDPQFPFCNDTNPNTTCRKAHTICVNKKCVCKAGFVADNDDADACNDVNECTQGTSIGLKSKNTGAGCSLVSCVNVVDGFYCCPSGYQNRAPLKDQTPTTFMKSCEDINECQLGLSSTQPSNNTKKPCEKSKCVNTLGSFLCCSPGFINPDDSTTGDLTACRDINECILGTSASEKSSNTGKPCDRASCVNSVGSFMCCPSGFENTDPERTITTNDLVHACKDINECILGTAGFLPSKNTKTPCTRSLSCVNSLGSFFCCPPGYRNADPNATKTEANYQSACQDIDECAEKIHNCPETTTFCENTEGSFLCHPCSGRVEVDPSKNNTFKVLKKFTPTEEFEFHHCFGSCEQGFRIFRYPSEASLACATVTNLSRILCSYPCGNLTARNTEGAAIDALETELNRGGFLSDVTSKIFPNTTVRFSPKRTNSMTFSVVPCTSVRIPELRELYQGLALEIVPNAPNLQVSVDTTCSVTISSKDPNNIPLIIGIITCCVALIVILIGLALLYYFYVVELSYLPGPIRWSYQQYRSNPFGWQFQGSTQSGYHFKELTPGSEFYSKAKKLYSTLESKTHENLVISGITAVYNPLLVRNFIGSYRIALSRAETAEFTTKKWEQEDELKTVDSRSFVYEEFQKICNRYEWNQKQNKSCSIIPALHGTDQLIAEKICQNGFAALSSLDSGYFGKGIYFTTHTLYTLPYVGTRSNPSIILSWVLPGNVYPVIEDHKGKHSLMGCAIKSGHGSHYVLTTESGTCIDRPGRKDVYDELVVVQESQISPAYIYTVDFDNIPRLLKHWTRDLPSQAVTPQQSHGAFYTPPPDINISLEDDSTF